MTERILYAVSCGLIYGVMVWLGEKYLPGYDHIDAGTVGIAVAAAVFVMRGDR